MSNQTKIPERNGQVPWQKILLGGLFVAFIWLVISRFNEVQKLTQTLLQGAWQWVLAAMALQVLFYLVFTGTYQTAFFVLDIPSKLLDLIPVMLGSLFVNVVTPTASTAGAALFVDDAARRGHSASRAATAMLLQLVADYTAILLVIAVGMTELFIRHDLQTYETLSAAILLLLNLALTSILLLGIWRPKVMADLLFVLQTIVNHMGGWLKRPDLLATDWASRNAAGFRAASKALTNRPKRLLRLLAITLLSYSINIASMYALFRAFGQSVSMGVLIAGFAMGILFRIVSPVPQGIGIVEGMLTLTYTSLGIPAATATVVSISFRGITFWLPLFLGFVLIRRTRTFHGADTAKDLG